MIPRIWALLVVLLVWAALDVGVASAHERLSIGTRKALATKAVTLASSMGDSHPSSLEVVYTDERHYLRVENPSGGGRSWIAPGTPVYFVAMRGHFVCPRCGRPITVLSTAYLARGLKPANPVSFRTSYPRLSLAGKPVRLSFRVPTT